MAVDAEAGAARRAAALLPLTAGILVGGVVAAHGTARDIAAAIGATSVLLLAAVARREGRGATMLLALALGLGGMSAATALARRPLAPDHIGRRVGTGTVAVEGLVLEATRAGEALRLTVRAERAGGARGHGTASGLLGVTVAHPRQSWPVGGRLRLVGRLRRPHNFGNPGGYDVERALARRGIVATVFLWDDTSLRLLTPPQPGVAAVLAAFRTRVAARIDVLVAPPARGFLAAVLLGDGGAVDAETQRMLTRTGLVHVVSVSGFHLAVVAGAGVLGLGWLLGRSERCALACDVPKIAALAGIAPVVLYACIAGGSVPASRALAMYGVLVGALLADRPPDAVRSLAAAALLLAVRVPDVLADVSFELSFVSVAALVVTAGVLRRQRRAAAAHPAASSAPGRGDQTGIAPGLSGRVRALVAPPLCIAGAAALATAPLTAWHFQQVSLIAPLANLAVLPLLGPATLLPGLVALPLVALAPPLGDALLGLAALAATAGLRVATAFAHVPGAAIATPMPSLLEVALAYAILALPFVPVRSLAAGAGPRAAALRERPRRLLACALLAAALADVGYWAWERGWNPRLRVTFLAVGQGDAAVVELPRGGVMVIDGGGLAGAFDTGERLVAPFLRSRKILRIDVLVLSHPQRDHYGGLVYLAEHFAPREFWSNGTRSDAEGFVRLERALARAGTRRVVLRRGAMPLARGAVRVDVVHPATADPGDPNNGSLVVRLAYGAAAILFSGDVEHAAEAAIVAAPVPLASTVLKVPHHGSATSSSAPLLRAVAPRVAIVSAGAENRFGFPASAVLARLAASGASVWRTDRDGAVQVESDGTRVIVSAPYGRRHAQHLDLNSPYRFGSSGRF